MKIKARTVLLSGSFALIVAGFVVGDFSTASRERFIVKAASSLPSPQSVPVSKLTTSVGDDLQPIWSPDGSTIAFLSNRRLGGNYRDLYRINPNGSNEQMVLQGSSPDNGWLFHPWWVGTTGDMLILDANWWDVNRFRLASAAAANALPVSLVNPSFFTYLFHVNGNDLAASFVTSLTLQNWRSKPCKTLMDRGRTPTAFTAGD